MCWCGFIYIISVFLVDKIAFSELCRFQKVPFYFLSFLELVWQRYGIVMEWIWERFGLEKMVVGFWNLSVAWKINISFWLCLSDLTSIRPLWFYINKSCACFLFFCLIMLHVDQGFILSSWFLCTSVPDHLWRIWRLFIYLFIDSKSEDIFVQALCSSGSMVKKHVNGIQESRAEMIISVRSFLSEVS